MRTVVAVGTWLVILAGAVQAQTTPEGDVLAVVRRLFDGMRAGDSAMVRSVFAAEARLVSTDTREGQPTVRVTTADAFVAAVGRPHDAIWDEQIWDTEIRVDGNLAAVWTKYAFFLGDRFSHCGVDAFHLVRRTDGWKIVDLADTRQREGCAMPPGR